MNAHAPLSEASDDARARRVLDRQLDLLDRLADIGMGIAETIGRQVAADAESRGEALDEPGRRAQVLNTSAMAYARAARAVRMSLALQSRLIEGPNPKGEAKDAKPQTVRVAWATDQYALHEKPRQVWDGVRRAGFEARLDFEAFERLSEETCERLEDDLYKEVMDRPVEEIIALVCRDLGVSLPPRSGSGRSYTNGPDGRDGGEPDALSEVAPEAEPPHPPDLETSAEHPHPRPFPHRGGREKDERPPVPGPS